MPTSIARRHVLRLVAAVLAAGAAQPLSAVAQTRATAPADASKQVGRGTVTLPAERRTLPADAIRQQVAGDSGFEKLLRMLPDGENHLRTVYLNDIALAARRAGLQPPARDADDAALTAYLQQLRRTGLPGGGMLSGMDDYPDRAIERREYLALSVANLTHAALISNPPYDVELVLGTFDPGATEAALSACGQCTPPVRETHQNVPFYSWGEDFAQSIRNRFKPPANDQLGRGGRIAVQPDFAYRTLWTEGMHRAVEASQGTIPTLADVTAYRVMAGAASGLGAHALFLTNDTSIQTGFGEAILGPLTGDSEDAIKNALDPAYLLRPYLAVALGAGSDEAGPYMTVGLLHPAPELAAENVGRLAERIKNTVSLREQRPWSELWGDIEARAEGHYLFARVRRLGDDPFAWLAWWTRRDSLLYWG
jgi:hypothetical protein